MTMRRTVLVSLVILFVALAGCTAPGQTEDTDNQGFTPTLTQSDGLSISFRSTSPTYFAGDRANFVIEATNTGEGDAYVTDIDLFRAAWISPNEGDILSDALEDRLKDLLSNALSTRDGSTGPNIWAGISAEVDNVLQSMGDSIDAVYLAPVDTANNIPGGSNSWYAQPEIDISMPAGSVHEYDVGAEVVYNYETRSRATFTVMPQEEFVEQAPTQQEVYAETSAGPIDVEVEGTSPLSASRGTINVPISISNVGDGRIENNEIDKIAVQVEAGYANVEQCSPNMNGYEISIEDLISIPALVSNPDALQNIGSWSAGELLRNSEDGLEGEDIDAIIEDMFLNLGFSAVGRDVPVFDGELRINCQLDISGATADSLERDLVLKTYMNYDYQERKNVQIEVRGQN